MSKQRRKRLNRNKRTRSRRSFIRNGVEQLESRVFPGGFLDLLAGAAIASNLDLLPAEEFVPEEIEAVSKTFAVQERSANTLLQTGLSLPDIDLEPRQVRTELPRTVKDLDVAPASPATASLLVTASFVDSFFTSNQFIDTTPHLLVSPSPPLSTPSRSFSSPISQLGAGVGSGSGQGYNVTGAELPQSNVASTSVAATSIPAWMLGEGEEEGEGGASASGSGGASGSGSGAGTSSGTGSASGSGSGGGTSTATGSGTCGASGSGSGGASASGYVSVSGTWANEDSGTITFTVSFTGSSPCGFTVDYHTEDGSAVAASATTYPWDYLGVATGDGHVSFGPGSGGTKTVDITLTWDQIVERNETFTLHLDSVHDGNGNGVGIGIGSGAGSASGSGSGMGGGGTATGTINNDDHAVASIAGHTYTNGPEGTSVPQTRLYAVHIDKQVDADIHVDLSTIDGTAKKADNDYGSIPGCVTISAGGQDAYFNISVPADWKIELDEKFQIQIDSITTDRDVVPDGIPFTDTIENDDIGTIRLATVNKATLQEVAPTELENDWGALEFRAILVHNEFPGHIVSVDTDIDISVTTTDVTASLGQDYTNSGSKKLVAGQMSVALPVTVTADAIVELTETFDLEIGVAEAHGRNVSGGGSLTATIEADDYAKVSITPSASTVEGNAGTWTDLSFTISLDKSIDRTVSVSATVTGGNGGNGDPASPGPAGQDYLVLDPGPFDLGGSAGNSKVMKVRVFGDSVNENNEYFQITLGNLSTNGLGSFVTIDAANATGTGTIIDDD
ncbi:MAG: hypothetical protein O3C40_18905 [Planctomycetota bacterium]|nr:hypothetical protein [Planctomycetota bacterium]